MGGMLGQRVRKILDVGLAARECRRLGVERFPDHDAQHARRHDERKGYDHHRGRNAVQRPVGVWEMSIGHFSP